MYFFLAPPPAIGGSPALPLVTGLIGAFGLEQDELLLPIVFCVCDGVPWPELIGCDGLRSDFWIALESKRSFRPWKSHSRNSNTRTWSALNGMSILGEGEEDLKRSFKFKL